jgi:alkylation response protein AidB-like acyl-CoA dehydrogenase
MKQRLDCSRNGMRIRQLKDKLGTKAVPSAEVELVDAEAFLMAPLSGGGGGGGGGGETGDGHGLARMMALTNVARVGIATMGLGCARRALVESLCYATARSAWKTRLIDQPLMRRKLVDMIVDVEAAQALVFDQHGIPNHQRRANGQRREPLRIGAALAKLRCARLGITMASDAIEVHGGNGYVETWPVARILRDAQINTLWEGPDNVLCLDVRRSIERENADKPLIERIREAVAAGDPTDDATKIVGGAAETLERAIAAWRGLDRDVGEARLFPLAQLMADVYAAALLVEQAAWEKRVDGRDRKAVVARIYARRQLADRGPLRGIDDARDEGLDRFDDLVRGTLVDDRPR